MKNFKIIVILAVILFTINILIHGIILFQIVQSAGKSKYYPEARSYFVASSYINRNFIVPINQAFGWDNILAKPFYPIRDYLYEKGQSKIPDGVGDKEIWWFKIRYYEFDWLILPEIADYSTHISKKYTKKQVQQFIKWDEEIYSHIEPFAKSKIVDPEFKKEKLSEFVNLATDSYNSAINLYTQINEEQGIKNKSSFDNKLISKYEKVLENYEDLKKYSKINEKDSYNYFFSKPTYDEAFLKFVISDEIIGSKYINKELSCSDKYLKVMADSFKELNNFHKNHYDSLTFSDKMRIELVLTTNTPVAYKCRNNKDLKDYIKHIEKKTGMSLEKTYNKYFKGR